MSLLPVPHLWTCYQQALPGLPAPGPLPAAAQRTLVIFVVVVVVVAWLLTCGYPADAAFQIVAGAAALAPAVASELAGEQPAAR